MSFGGNKPIRKSSGVQKTLLNLFYNAKAFYKRSSNVISTACFFWNNTKKIYSLFRVEDICLVIIFALPSLKQGKSKSVLTSYCCNCDFVVKGVLRAVVSWLATCARKPKVPGSSLAASMCRGELSAVIARLMF